MTRGEIADWAQALEGRPPEEILRAASERFPQRLTFATGFGAEGCVLIDLVARHGVKIDLFTLDTGHLFPQTYALWAALEARYGVSIRGVRGVPKASEGERPWEHDSEGCCEARKVAPLRVELGRFDAWVTAIRRDQTAHRADAKVIEWDGKFSLVKVNPLAAWTAADISAYVETHRVPVNPLHALGYPSIGCAPCTTPVRPGEDPRAGRWRNSSKTECGLHARPLPAGSPTQKVEVSHE